MLLKERKKKNLILEEERFFFVGFGFIEQKSFRSPKDIR